MNIFEREEKKYLVPEEKYPALMKCLSDKLCRDKYFRYKIYNYYYDTQDYELMRLSADSPVYKEKLRMRGYEEPREGAHVFLEIKKKYDGIVYKRRIEGEYGKIMEVISDPSIRPDDSVSEKEIKWFLQRYRLLPLIRLDYEREAYVWHDIEELRVTFDRNISYRLTEQGGEMKNIFSDNTVLMEIKSVNNIPRVFADVLCSLEIYPASFSKVGAVYKKAVLPEYIKRFSAGENNNYGGEKNAAAI